MLAGRDEVTEERAQAAAAAFLDLDAARLQATGRSEGDVPCWNFDIDDGDDTSYIAVTVSGVWHQRIRWRRSGRGRSTKSARGASSSTTASNS